MSNSKHPSLQHSQQFMFVSVLYTSVDALKHTIAVKETHTIALDTLIELLSFFLLSNCPDLCLES